MKDSNLKLISVFFLSAAVIAYEIAVMRSFSVGSWSNFGSMVISIALLGFGLAGTFLTFFQKYVKNSPDSWLTISAIVFPPAMTFGHILAQKVPFNPVLIASDPGQIWWIGVYYLIYSVPFLCGALFIGISFIALSSQIHRLYFSNMVGSGLGGFFILFFMYIFPPDTLIIPILVLSFVGCFFCSISFSIDRIKKRLMVRNIILSIIGFSLSIVCIILFGKIEVSEFKSVSYVRKFPEYNLDYYSYNPSGEIHVYSSSFFHFAPGLSDNAAGELEVMPKNAFKGLYIDGGGPIGIMRDLKEEEKGYIDYLPMTAPYILFEHPEVLLIRLGGGASVFTALHHKAEKIVVLEPNPEIIRLFRDIPVIRDFSGDLLYRSPVKVWYGEPRAYCSKVKEKFDIVEISLIDSIGITQIGGYPVVENFTYTVESISEYMDTLKDNGFLSITVWNKLSPPRNVLRLLTTVVAALKRQGIQNPEKNIFMFHMLLQTATIIVKKTDYTDSEIKKLKSFCRKMSFNMDYYPGIEIREKDFERILLSYTELFSKPDIYTFETAESSSTEGDKGGLLSLLEEVGRQEDSNDELNPGDLYHFSLIWMLSGKMEELIKKYIFDIRSVTDDRPYYTAYIKPQKMGLFFNNLDKISEEWGYLLIFGTLIQSILFGFLIIVIPLVGCRKELFKKQNVTFGVIIYYACLGLGYMLIEIFLIQKLAFFLENPIFSLSIVITSMLVFSGIGSLFCRRFQANRTKGVRFAVLGIGLCLLFYIFSLTPLIRALLGFPFYIKLILSILIIAPMAFFLGMPFPSGLSTLSKNRKGLLPWAWGMNGALSVTGSVIARLISISAGFTTVLLLSLFLYFIAGIVFPANYTGKKE